MRNSGYPASWVALYVKRPVSLLLNFLLHDLSLVEIGGSKSNLWTLKLTASVKTFLCVIDLSL